MCVCVCVCVCVQMIDRYALREMKAKTDIWIFANANFYIIEYFF